MTLQKLNMRLTCDAEDSSSKQQPAFLSISPKEMDYVVGWQSFEYTRVMVYNAINSHKWSTEGPCTHDGGEKEAHTGGAKFLQQEQNN